MQITAKAPTRIDLAGGTLDIWPLYLLYDESITINLAINLFATASLQPLPDSRIQIVSKDQNASLEAAHLTELSKDGQLSLLSRLIHHFAPTQGFHLETDCKAPAGSGLGGSSALAIAVSGALNELTQKRYASSELVEI